MELETSDLFLDASFAIALVSSRDEHHAKAVTLAERHANHPFVTTRAVLLEIGNALSGVGRRDVTVSYLETVEEEPATEIVPLSDALFGRGFDLYRERSDKSWGLTDCISFVVMRERGIRAALTADADSWKGETSRPADRLSYTPLAQFPRPPFRSVP